MICYYIMWRTSLLSVRKWFNRPSYGLDCMVLHVAHWNNRCQVVRIWMEMILPVIYLIDTVTKRKFKHHSININEMKNNTHWTQKSLWHMRSEINHVTEERHTTEVELNRLMGYMPFVLLSRTFLPWWNNFEWSVDQRDSVRD